MSDGFLLESELFKARIAVHEVLHDNHHLHDELPVLVLLLACLCLLGAVSDVLALVCHAVLASPLHGLLKLYVVVDAFCHAADDFGEVNALVAHTEILLEEVRIDDRTCDTHTCRTHREVRLAAHCSHCLSSACEAQNLLCYVSRDRVVGEVLHVVSVDAECGQTLLCVSSEHGCQIYCARTLCAVEAPYSLRPVWVHVHCLSTVAPA